MHIIFELTFKVWVLCVMSHSNFNQVSSFTRQSERLENVLPRSQFSELLEKHRHKPFHKPMHLLHDRLIVPHLQQRKKY